MQKDEIRAGAEPAGADVDQSAESLQLHMKGLFDEVFLYLKVQWREHPAAVVTTALGAGLILGTLIRGRR